MRKTKQNNNNNNKKNKKKKKDITFFDGAFEFQ